MFNMLTEKPRGLNSQNYFLIHWVEFGLYNKEAVMCIEKSLDKSASESPQAI